LLSFDALAGDVILPDQLTFYSLAPLIAKLYYAALAGSGPFEKSSGNAVFNRRGQRCL
jgi:hypothetical protein